MGDILDLARRDANFIIKSGGLQSDIIFRNPLGDDVPVQGIATKHHMSYDEDGQLQNAKNAHITVNESDLTDAGIVTRNGTGEVYLLNMQVAVADSTGVVKEYVIRQNWPNETLGHIVCLISDFE